LGEILDRLFIVAKFEQHIAAIIVDHALFRRELQSGVEIVDGCVRVAQTPARDAAIAEGGDLRWDGKGAGRERFGQ